jgi:hypothetical protein
MQEKATETAKPLGATTFKLGEVGLTDSCIVKDCHPALNIHLSNDKGLKKVELSLCLTN